MAALQSCPALDQTHVPSAGLGSGMSSGPGVRVVGHQGAGILSRRRRRLRGGLADATEYRFRPVRPAASKHTRVPLACHYHRSTTVNSGSLWPGLTMERDL